MAEGVIFKKDIYNNSIIDLNLGNGTSTPGTASTNKLVWNVLGYTTGTIMIIPDSDITGAILTIQRSNDGVNFVGLEAAKTMSGTTSPVMCAAIDTSAFAYLALTCTTTKGSAGTVTAIACFKKTNS